jgi:hypothetical protein
MTALYNLANEYLKLAETLADGDFDAATIADTIEASGITDDIAGKAQALEYVARSAEAHNGAIDAEIERLQALKKHRVSVAAGVRKYLFDNMQRMGIGKIDCPLFTLDIVKNPPSVEIYDTMSIPAEYTYTPEPVVKIDKVKIKEAIKAGKEVPGAKLESSTRLRIK